MRFKFQGPRFSPPRLLPYGGLRGLGAEACGPIAPGRRIRVCAQWTDKPGPQVRGARDVCRILRGAVAADRESFYTLQLDVRNRLIGLEEVSKGSLMAVEVNPREVFKSAVLTNAASLIMAHNHPSGSNEPSREDIALTRQLATLGQMMGIPVRDHVIVAADGCRAMRGEVADIAFGRARRPRRRSRRKRR